MVVGSTWAFSHVEPQRPCVMEVRPRNVVGAAFPLAGSVTPTLTPLAFATGRLRSKPLPEVDHHG